MGRLIRSVNSRGQMRCRVQGIRTVNESVFHHVRVTAQLNIIFLLNMGMLFKLQAYGIEQGYRDGLVFESLFSIQLLQRSRVKSKLITLNFNCVDFISCTLTTA